MRTITNARMTSVTPKLKFIGVETSKHFLTISIGELSGGEWFIMLSSPNEEMVIECSVEEALSTEFAKPVDVLIKRAIARANTHNEPVVNHRYPKCTFIIEGEEDPWTPR